MRFYQTINVYDAALERIRYIFDEFPNVIVGFSGGKDSTVTLQMALIVAEEKGRLPLKVQWVDQEAEWTETVAYCESVFKDPRIEPLWMQIPLKIHNSGSYDHEWITSWNPEEEDKWIRSKSDIAIKENTYGVERWKYFFKGYMQTTYPEEKACYLSGVRTEESPARFIGLTNSKVYKHLTYGSRLSDKQPHVTLYPLYDWSYNDIWLAIHTNKWEYCKVYDDMFKYGIKIPNMRVSNLHHETATRSLIYAQEIDKTVWNKLSERVHGANAFKHMKSDAWKLPDKLPEAFKTWEEYAVYLFNHLIPDGNLKESFGGNIRGLMHRYKELPGNAMWRIVAASVIANDVHGTKINNWESSPNVNAWRRWKWQGEHTMHNNPYINEEITRGNY